MADVSGTHLRGLIVPDDRMNQVWDAQSSYTQADPQVGSAEPDSVDSRLVLEGAGSMDAGVSLAIKTMRPGHAGSGGAFVWRNAADASTLHRGRDPMSISGHEVIEWNTAGVGTQQAHHPANLALANHTVICAYHRTSGGVSTVQIRTRPRDGSWSSASTLYTGAATDENYHPALALLEDGSVLCAFLVTDRNVSPAELNVRIHRSTDNGATWAIHSAAALKTAIPLGSSVGAGQPGYAAVHLSLASNGGQVLIMASLVANDTSPTYRAVFQQFASDDLGGSFELVETGPGTLFVARAIVLDIDGGFLVVYLGTNTNISLIASRAMADAFAPFTAAEVTNIYNGDTEFGSGSTGVDYLADGDLAACVADDGAIYVLTRAIRSAAGATLNIGTMTRSVDGGQTWQGMGLSSISSDGDIGIWYQVADSNTYPTGFAACYAEGRLVLCSLHSTTPSTHDPSLSAIYIGGHTSVTMPGRGLAAIDTNRATWDIDWLPFELPRDTCFNGSGAATESIANGWLDYSATAAQALYYYIDSSSVTELVTPVATGAIMTRHALQMTAGGSSATDRQCVEVRLADGVNSYRVSARHEALGWALYDTIAGSRIGDAIVISGAYEFLISLSAGSVSSWYRPLSHDADRTWTVGPSSTSLSDGGAAYASNRVLWGAKVTAASTVSAKWFALHVSAESSGRGLSSGQVNPDDLYPNAYASAGRSAYLTGGVGVSARGGPAIRGEGFSLATAYGYPLDRVRQSYNVSPRRQWRSTGVASPVTIAFALDSVNPAAVASLYSDTLAVMAVGSNFRTGKIQGYDGAAWVDLATLDTAEGMSFTGSFVRYGNTLVASAVAVTSTHIHQGELVGWVAVLNGTTHRRIVNNTEGVIVSGGTAGKRLTVELAGVDGTEPTAAITVAFVPPVWACFVNLLGVRFSGYRLLIDAQTTVDGYFTRGGLYFGSFHAFGHQYSLGRTLETAPAVRTHTTADRMRSLSVIAPPARTVDIAWVEGVVTDQTSKADAVPDFVTASSSAGAKPIATSRGTPWTLEGLLRGMFRDGASENAGIVGYVPSLERVTDGDDTTLINRRHQLIVGFVDQPVRLETVLGSEEADEVVRVASLSIREIV